MSGLGSLDPRSIIFMFGVICALMTLVLLSLWRSYPATIHGLDQWAAAPAVQGIAAVLLSERGALSPLLTVVLGNVLLLAGIGLLQLGTEGFLGASRSSLRRGLALLAATGLLLAWFTWVQPHYGARLVVVTLAFAVIAGAQIVLLLRQGEAFWPTWFMLGLWALWGLGLLLRLPFVWDIPSDALLMYTTGQRLYVTGNVLALLLCNLAIVFMANHRLRREMAYLARRDLLTQALTRHAFIETCELELERCRRHHRDMALLLLDIDHFKAINEANGQRVGDEVILDFVARMYGVLRRSDQVGRYGGEQFLVLLPETGPQEALAVAERIRSRTAAMHLSLPSYTVSIGVTVNLPGEDGIDTLVRRAESALRQAKNKGRNRVIFV